MNENSFSLIMLIHNTLSITDYKYMLWGDNNPFLLNKCYKSRKCCWSKVNHWLVIPLWNAQSIILPSWNLFQSCASGVYTYRLQIITSIELAEENFIKLATEARTTHITVWMPVSITIITFLCIVKFYSEHICRLVNLWS
jgi:hypothetical protein